MTGALPSTRGKTVVITGASADNLTRPVHDLHSIHGSFDRESSRAVSLVSGETDRIGAVLFAGTLAFGAGVLALHVPGSARTRAVSR